MAAFLADCFGIPDLRSARFGTPGWIWCRRLVVAPCSGYRRCADHSPVVHTGDLVTRNLYPLDRLSSHYRGIAGWSLVAGVVLPIYVYDLPVSCAPRSDLAGGRMARLAEADRLGAIVAAGGSCDEFFPHGVSFDQVNWVDYS